MNYKELTINGETYKLRLNTRTTIALEKTLKCNPLEVLMKIDEGQLPKMTDIVVMFHAMLQQYHHGFSLEKTYDLFDDYMAEGYTMFDFVQNVLIEVFQNSGFINANAAVGEEEKN